VLPWRGRRGVQNAEVSGLNAREAASGASGIRASWKPKGHGVGLKIG